MHPNYIICTLSLCYDYGNVIVVILLISGLAKTEVSNITDYPPIEKMEYRLHCDVTDVGNPAITSFIWYGEQSTDQTLVIDSLDRSQHSKTFQCAATNKLGEGPMSDGLPIQVWCK